MYQFANLEIQHEHFSGLQQQVLLLCIHETTGLLFHCHLSQRGCNTDATQLGQRV